MTGPTGKPTVRAARPNDFEPIIAVVDDWWGRPVSVNVSRLFLDHFHDTSLVAETDDGRIVGFVIGFLSPADPDCAYIHFTGVAPEARRTGLARDLYDRFFTVARAAGRTKAKAVTSPLNTRSIAFHEAVGFTVSDPVPDYDGPGLDRVVFRRDL
ncbi:GNAT family N-acetyltransferase [Spiractinospora alimapuensis]|uniref:GNAT family N-acetyltransferase n=1 Tax=Spiractinospora alimapuensis TaxID=2820884 RepID=UPI001F21E74E|nr:GNAT family N-acetyltransferase [Spiractinospora alimapuensis]QVQ53754.1 GNAT family N-acetyltransferase [Spiractinospora alimapuensis]